MKNIPFTKVTVVVRPCHSDIVTFETQIESTRYLNDQDEERESTSFSCNQAYGSGAQWVHDVFHVEPEVIDVELMRRSL